MRSVPAFVLLVAATAVLAPSLDAQPAPVPACNPRAPFLEGMEAAAHRHFEFLQCMRGPR